MSVEIIQGDCIEVMHGMFIDGFKADLIFADPPFNIGYSYDVYDDKRQADDYLFFTRGWMIKCCLVLKDEGSLWFAAPDEQEHRLKCVAEDLKLKMQAHCIWRFTFGQNRKRGFTRSHVHLLHYTRSKRFTWNGDAVKVPSWRQLNGDKRAAPGGRHPDDVWDFPRICGTHKERTGHPCQMPEALMARIIRVSSNPGDVVLDPFLGSGATGAVAKKLGRDFVGIELSENYAAKAKDRIDGVNEGDPIQGEREQVAAVRGNRLNQHQG